MGYKMRCHCGLKKKRYKIIDAKPVEDLCKRCGNDANKFYKESCTKGTCKMKNHWI